MELLEKLEYHLNRLQEANGKYVYVYSNFKKQEVEICINPSNNEFRSFIKNKGVRGLLHKGNFYFWGQYSLLHEQVASALGLRYSDAADLIGRSFELTSHNSVHADHWDKIAELQGGMDKSEFFRFLAKCLNTLKQLNSTYNTNIGDIKRTMEHYVYSYYEREWDPRDRMTKQQRHDYRKAQYEKRNKEVLDIFRGRL